MVQKGIVYNGTVFPMLNAGQHPAPYEPYTAQTVTVSTPGALRGIHKTVFPMLVNICAICLPRVLWVWFVFPHFNSANMLYLIYPLSWGLSALLMSITYYRARKGLLAAQPA